MQYDVVATMPTDFPNPLSQAECVSLVMAYEFCRISGLEGREVTLHDWMCPQTGSEEGVSICKFAVSSINYHNYLSNIDIDSHQRDLSINGLHGTELFCM